MTQMVSPTISTASISTSQAPAADETKDEKTKEIFALSFGPGAFDTMVQLGVIHALLVSRRRPPDVVLGISAGAANAVALGEVFAEEGIHGQVSRFREILNAARNSLRVFRYELSPDPLELNTENALAPMELPIHHNEERAQRRCALRSVVGILRLFNDVTKLQITLHVVVQLTQRILSIQESLALKDPDRYRSATMKAFVRLALFVLLYQWRFILPAARAGWRMIVLHLRDGTERNIKPIGHFLSLWRRLLALGVLKITALVSLIPGSYVLSRWIEPHLSDVVSSPMLTGMLLALMLMAFLPAALLVAGLILALHGPSSTLTATASSKWHSRLLLPLLKTYDLHDQLFNPYVLKQFLISTFDRQYYGRFNIDQAVNAALQQEDISIDHYLPRRVTFERYLAPPYPMHIAIAGTKLSTGETEIFSRKTPIIDAIMASMAFPPFFKPQRIKTADGKREDHYIDPACIGEEPIAPLMEYLRTSAISATKAIHVFHITPFPAQEPISREDSFTSMTAITSRSIELLRCRHVSLEQKLTRQYTKLLPQGRAIHPINTSPKQTQFVAAKLFPIDTEFPLHVTRHFLMALSNEDREKTVLHAIATGCRTTLQRILAPDAAGHYPPASHIKCRRLITELGLQPEQFPGSDPDSGPGLREVCAHCTLLPLDQIQRADPATQMQVLRVLEAKPDQPVWAATDGLVPRQNTRSAASPNGPAVTSSSLDPIPTVNQEPWVSTLWSGGVFRGVFQIGAINAYNEAHLKPHIFAGASVGSIMAAFAARVTSLSEYESKVAIQKAAATFIGLDKLVVTDRFADLVRRFTIRANDVHLTPKILDHVFRRFDFLGSTRFHRSVRLVAAGFERLCYISPFELLELTRAIHDTDSEAVERHLLDAIDYFFERSGAGLEVLGAEPLHMLITEHVLGGRDSRSERTMTVSGFLDGLRSTGHQRHLLICTTDLTNGVLHVIGEDSYRQPTTALLVEGLLAGSAFPGVFRPRRRSEVYPTHPAPSVLVDGGIMDNLPLDPIVRFIKNAADGGLVARRPAAPHLILAASLERRVRDIHDQAQLDRFDEDWRALQRRTVELQYNRKLTVFTNAQRHFRQIHRHYPYQGTRPPLDLVVGTIKPEWLCGTFGFHTMLGFTQVKQAASIAHGCAMTLATLSQLQESEHGSRWGISMEPIEQRAFCYAPARALEKDSWCEEGPGDRVVNAEYLESMPPPDRNEKSRDGLCWFREGAVCPFSAAGLRRWNGGFPEGTRDALKTIYDLCGQASTHAQRGD